MNIASRVAKQVEVSDNLVPKNQTGSVTPFADLQELYTTVNSVRTTLVPFVTSSKKSKTIAEPGFDINIRGIKDTLGELHNFFKDLEKEFSAYTWKTQKVKIYQMDFTLKQKLDQFTGLFNIEEPKDKKVTKERFNNGANLISDPDARDLWIKCFGENTVVVPWTAFCSSFDSIIGPITRDDEEFIKMFLDFTKDDQVSSYEFGVFLKMFGPLKGSCQRLMDSLRGGLLCGFVPAVEANLLLEGKKEGTFLVRCSKTQPGSFAVTFVDNVQKIKHCLLYNVTPNGLTLKNPPTVYNSLTDFAEAHVNKLKHPLGNKWTALKGAHGFQYNEKALEPASSPPMSPTISPKEDSNQCVVCMDAPFETVFLECGHLACCAKCSEKLKLCPICRKPILRIIPIFRAT